MYYGAIPQEDLEADASYLGMSKEEFIAEYLKEKPVDGRYTTQHNPCDFLDVNGFCKLGERRPESCKKFPYTDQPERLQSLYSVLEAVEVCPVAFEIYERLKKEYGFRYKR